MTAISVTVDVRRRFTADSDVRQLVRRIAEEYGLAWAVQLDGGILTVRFARRETVR